MSKYMPASPVESLKKYLLWHGGSYHHTSTAPLSSHLLSQAQRLQSEKVKVALAEDAQSALVKVAANSLGAGIVQCSEVASLVKAGERRPRQSADETGRLLCLGDGLLNQQQLTDRVEEDTGRPDDAVLVEPQFVLLRADVMTTAGEDARSLYRLT